MRWRVYEVVRRVVSRWGVVERSLWVFINHEVLGVNDGIGTCSGG